MNLFVRLTVQDPHRNGIQLQVGQETVQFFQLGLIQQSATQLQRPVFKSLDLELKDGCPGIVFPGEFIDGRLDIGHDFILHDLSWRMPAFPGKLGENLNRRYD